MTDWHSKEKEMLLKQSCSQHFGSLAACCTTYNYQKHLPRNHKEALLICVIILFPLCIYLLDKAILRIF